MNIDGPSSSIRCVDRTALEPRPTSLSIIIGATENREIVSTFIALAWYTGFTHRRTPDNWSDHYPTSELPPRDFPVKILYPLAHYADSTRFHHLRSLILPLPLTRQRTPTPPPEDVSEIYTYSIYYTAEFHYFTRKIINWILKSKRRIKTSLSSPTLK